MKRRGFMAALAALPFVGGTVEARPTKIATPWIRLHGARLRVAKAYVPLTIVARSAPSGLAVWPPGETRPAILTKVDASGFTVTR